jgi:hypothetical protein
MNLEIEHGVPVPEREGPPYALLVEAFSKMQVGDSVVFTGNHSWVHALARAVGIRIRVRRAEAGKTLASRGIQKLRIWRI